MQLSHITAGCLAPPSFRAQDFLLQMKELHGTLHILEVLGCGFLFGWLFCFCFVFCDGADQELFSGADFHMGVARTGPNSHTQKKRHLQSNGAIIIIIKMKPHIQSSHKKIKSPQQWQRGRASAGPRGPKAGPGGPRAGPGGLGPWLYDLIPLHMEDFPSQAACQPISGCIYGCVYKAAVIRRDATGSHRARASILPPRRARRDPASRSHAKRQKRYFLPARRSDSTSFAAIYNQINGVVLYKAGPLHIRQHMNQDKHLFQFQAEKAVTGVFSIPFMVE